MPSAKKVFHDSVEMLIINAAIPYVKYLCCKNFGPTCVSTFRRNGNESFEMAYSQRLIYSFHELMILYFSTKHICMVQNQANEMVLSSA